MTSRFSANNFIIYLVLIAFAAGCTSMQPLSATRAESLASQVNVGDRIKITRNDLSEVTFKVGAVSGKGISGDGMHVDYSDIRQVDVRQFSTGKTVGLIIGILAVAAMSASASESLVDSLFSWIWN